MKSARAETAHGIGLKSYRRFTAGSARNALRSAQPTDENASELGPKAPDGKAGNWLATVPVKGYPAILRLHGRTEAGLVGRQTNNLISHTSPTKIITRPNK